MHEFMLSCDNILVLVHQIHVDISFEQLTINWFSSCAGFPGTFLQEFQAFIYGAL